MFGAGQSVCAKEEISKLQRYNKAGDLQSADLIFSVIKQ